MYLLVHPVQRADQGVDGSQDDIGMGAHTPVFVSVFSFNADIGRSLGIGVGADGMLGVGDELVVEMIICLLQAVADCIQTTVSVGFQIVLVSVDDHAHLHYNRIFRLGVREVAEGGVGDVDRCEVVDIFLF